MIEKIEVPDFATEAEEAKWWFDHRDEHDARLLAATEDGSARSVVDVLFEHGLTLEGLKEVALPIRPEDIELARRLAGMPASITASTWEDCCMSLWQRTQRLKTLEGLKQR